MRLKRAGVALTILPLVVLPACSDESQAAPRSGSREAITKGADERTGAYDVVPGWWKEVPNHDDEWMWGNVAGVAVDNADRIIVIARGDFPADQSVPRRGRTRSTNFIVVADRNGNIVEQWSQWDSIFTLPHQVYINPYDPERHVWVVDGGGADGPGQVVKFTNDGSELVMRLGDPDNPKSEATARAIADPDPFSYGLPAKLAFLPDGSFLLADGYWNSRVIKYTGDGEFVMKWGSQGTGPGEFDLLHGLALDRAGRVYVSDRQNERIQIFTPGGEFIEEWTGIFDPVNIFIDENESVWVLDASLNRVSRYSMEGELLYHWGAYGEAGALGRGTWDGGLSLPHQMDVDEEGNLYIASYNGRWVNKFVPKSGADPAKLVAPRMLLSQ